LPGRPAGPDEGRPLDLVTRLTVTYAQLYTERLIPVQSPWEGRSLSGGTIGLPLRANNFGPYRVRGHGVRRGGAPRVHENPAKDRAIPFPGVRVF
jgi:hypothetical protein